MHHPSTRRRLAGFAASVAALLLSVASTGAFATCAASAPGDGTCATLRSSASPAAKDLYAYIATRPLATSANGLIAGQHLGGINNLNTGDGVAYGDSKIYLDHTVSGKYPAMIGVRYDGSNGKDDSAPYVVDPTFIGFMNAVLIGKWQVSHAIVAVTATPRNPWDPAPTAGRGPSDADQPLSTLLRTPANQQANLPAYNKFWTDAGVIADGLETLKAQGIPVVLRPFAEYNSGKYYGPHGSGTTATSADFKALWADVWSFYVNDRHLNNLIFCWEAWVMGRNTTTAALSDWFPDPSTVDLVSGAYYFPAPTSTYFREGTDNALTLTDVPPSNMDLTTHTNLLAVANTNNKPFGVAQWGLDYVPGSNCSKTVAGLSADATGFYNSVLSPASNRKLTSFIYHWQDTCAIDLQQNATAFVATPSTATADEIAQVVLRPSGPSGIPDGWVLDTANAPGNPGARYQTAAGPLITGDTASNFSYRSILSFDTSGIPANAIITSVTLRMRFKSSVGANLFAPTGGLGVLTVDIAGVNGFSNNRGLEKSDFQWSTANGDITNIGILPDPALDSQGWSEATLSTATFNVVRAGLTQLRVRFKSDNATSGTDRYVSWYNADTSSSAGDYPQLVVAYKY